MGKTERIFPLSEIGGRIQKRRHELNLSRAKLYDKVFNEGKAGSDDSKDRTVLNWESNKTELSYNTLVAMCKALQCSSDYLLGLDECPTKSIQFIHDYTGLSTEAINQLNFLSHFPEPNLRNNVVCLNDLIEHNFFSVSLLQNIVKFFFQYWDYKKGEKLYEDEKKRKPQTSDICEEIKLKESGYEPLITNKQLEELAEKKDITLFHITTDFSNLIKELAKYHDSKSKEKTPNSKRH